MSKQHFDETYSLKDAPRNYERYFVPAIGEPVAKELLREADLHSGERVLDVACGTGIVARLANKRVGNEGSVTGLDINPGMLAVARSLDDSIDWHQAGAEAMPLPDDSFDVVLCQLSLQFMEDKPAALKEMHRVLEPGGRFILNLPGPAGPVFSRLAGAMERHIGAEAADFVMQVFSLNDPDELRPLLRDAGFLQVVVKTAEKVFSLPPPEEFLWQYVHSTPLAGVVSAGSGMDEDTRSALEQEVVAQWQEFVEDGAFIYRQRILTAAGSK